ncbi:hypothetical protein OIU85_007372 [Salix viminalis]|uniref:Uncharacterized protein n=1 Tax=Salix viminalis TaxID=40686 RepID=A0A9Q0SNU7_SALVM|nr:hypothetical protein OIU85_007372 [Salix viminalis]
MERWCLMGPLQKMKTREKKYKPIALYVNSVHHVHDRMAYPWQWTWKDVSTKDVVVECGNEDEFDWVEGLTHWSNFLRYKEVFGDLPVAYGTNGSNCSDLMGVLNEDRENGGGLLGGVRGMDMVEFGQIGNSADGDFAGIDGGENGVLSLGFDYEGEEAEENCNGNDRVREDGDDGFMYEEPDPNVSNLRKKRKALKGLRKRVFGFLSNQLGQLRDMEARFEQRELERERERQKRESIRAEREREWERKLEEREKGERRRWKRRGKS